MDQPATGSGISLARVLAGRRNAKLRRPWSEPDRERQRELCLMTRPWQDSTGPRTPEGKAKSAANGHRRRCRSGSRRRTKAEITDVYKLMDGMSDLRRALGL